MDHFFDTSAFFKRYVREAGSPAVDTIFGEYARRYVSAIGLLECFSNLQRLHSVDGLVTTAQLRSLRAEVASDIREGRVITVHPTPADVSAAAQLLGRRYLAAVDALHIAMAKSLGPEIRFVSSDAKLNRVAAQEGLTVFDPTESRQR
ncbi:MAG: type II toxin-antitoxin system VapC family toxin [Bacillota bacterium]